MIRAYITYNSKNQLRNRLHLLVYNRDTGEILFDQDIGTAKGFFKSSRKVQNQALFHKVFNIVLKHDAIINFNVFNDSDMPSDSLINTDKIILNHLFLFCRNDFKKGVKNDYFFKIFLRNVLYLLKHRLFFTKLLIKLDYKPRLVNYAFNLLLSRDFIAQKRAIDLLLSE